MHHPVDYIATLPDFGIYFISAAVLMSLFIIIYTKVTPYREFALIAEGNVAPAITLAGSLFGFILPLCEVIESSVSLPDMLIWGGIALLVQLLAFGIINMVFPAIKQHVKDGQVSSAILLASLTLAVGWLNAACMSW